MFRGNHSPCLQHSTQVRAGHTLSPSAVAFVRAVLRMMLLAPSPPRAMEGAGACVTLHTGGCRKGLRKRGTRVEHAPFLLKSNGFTFGPVSAWVPVGVSAQVRGKQTAPWKVGLQWWPGLGFWSLLTSWDPVILHSASAICGLGTACWVWTCKSDRWREDKNKPREPGQRPGRPEEGQGDTR